MHNDTIQLSFQEKQICQAHRNQHCFRLFSIFKQIIQKFKDLYSSIFMSIESGRDAKSSDNNPDQSNQSQKASRVQDKVKN